MGKTKKVVTGISSAALLTGLAGCGTYEQSLPPQPEDPYCDEWEWESEDGVWECDDYTSTHYGHTYFGNTYHSSKSNLHNSSAFKSYKSSSSFKGGGTISSGKSGFGSSGSFGG